MHKIRNFCLITAFFLLFHFVLDAQEHDWLPSWNDTDTKRAIIKFVEKTTEENSPNFVPPSDRIAVFDQDGTLWVEKPLYTQLIFAIDRIKALASSHPEWKTIEPFKSILENNKDTLTALSEHDVAKILIETHSGMSVGDYYKLVV